MTMLLPFINQQLNGAIWRIEIDSLSKTIFLEIRNSVDKIVSFTSIDLSNGKINFTDLTTPERWLTGIEAAYNGVLLLHGYQSENSPVHKGLIAINNTGETIWSNYTYALDHLSINGPIVYNIQLQPKKLFLADIETGATLKPFDPSVDNELFNHIVAPDILSADVITRTLPVEPYGNIVHYLEHNNFRIVSLHSLTDGQLKQHLFIMNGTELIYEDLLNGDIQKMQPESFIMHQNSLIYIKNKSQLKVLSL